MRFYGFYWSFGVGTTNTSGERIGRVVVFASRAERDRWVADDLYDGSFHRSDLSARSARDHMAHVVYHVGHPLAAKWETVTGLVRWCPIGDLITAYCEAVA